MGHGAFANYVQTFRRPQDHPNNNLKNVFLVAHLCNNRIVDSRQCITKFPSEIY